MFALLSYSAATCSSDGVIGLSDDLVFAKFHFILGLVDLMSWGWLLLLLFSCKVYGLLLATSFAITSEYRKIEKELVQLLPSPFSDIQFVHFYFGDLWSLIKERSGVKQKALGNKRRSVIGKCGYQGARRIRG